MTRLINADKFEVVSYVGTEGYEDTFDEGVRFVLELIDKAPTVDAEPVRHGHWEWNDNANAFHCSCCDSGYKNQPTLMGEPMFEWCPICGARMDSERKEE